MLILVPQGAEYHAVQRALQGRFPVLAIPAGSQAALAHLKQLQASEQLQDHDQLLVMGLCGALAPHLQVGDVVIYQDCVTESQSALACDPELTTTLAKQLQGIPAVRAITSDRVVCTAVEKRQLGQQTGAAVVDMEGFPILQALQNTGLRVAMVRVISDDAYGNIPNLAEAFDPTGKLQVLPLLHQFVAQPIAAIRLIRGALKGLRILGATAQRLSEG